MSLYHNLQIMSWHKHAAKTSQMDTAMQIEFCHWERQQTNLLSLKKTKSQTPLPLCLPHHYLCPKGPVGTLGCLGYSSSVAAVQRKLQPWDFTQLHLRVNVTKWHFSFLPLMYDKIRQIWQKWRWDIKKKKNWKIHATTHFSEWKGTYLYMSLNDREKEEATHLPVMRGNDNKTGCL